MATWMDVFVEMITKSSRKEDYFSWNTLDNNDYLVGDTNRHVVQGILREN